MSIHKTAIVDPKAKLAPDVIIGAYSIIGPNVSIGAGSVIGPHVVIEGRATIGANNRIYSFACIGYPPQDLSYHGEDTEVVIGSGNTIREHVTIHRGTCSGHGVTRIGDNNFLMAGAHVAHDCLLGNHVVLANTVNLGGHVQVGDHASIGGNTAVHQFVRIGVYAFIGGASGLNKDVPPFMLASGMPARLFGPNLIGLRRNGFSPEAIQALRRSYRILFRSGLPLEGALEKVRMEITALPEVEALIHFVSSSSSRGIMRRSSGSQ